MSSRLYDFTKACDLVAAPRPRGSSRCDAPLVVAEYGGRMSEPWKRIEIDGQAPTVENLQVPALVSYGHYTSMQVRNRGVRGLQLHLARLQEATQELYGGELDAELVRDRIRHALGDDIANASARVQVFSPDEGEHLSIMVVVSEPVEPPSATQALRSIGYLRPAATFKHVGGFGQHYYWRLASRDGFDDALLTGPDGSISETTIANIGFSTAMPSSGRTHPLCSARPCSCSTGSCEVADARPNAGPYASRTSRRSRPPSWPTRTGSLRCPGSTI
jgi:Amino-transferase class IV